MWVSFVKYVSLFCRICESLLSKMWVSFVEYVGLFCQICRSLLSNMWVSFVKCVGLFCQICGSDDLDRVEEEEGWSERRRGERRTHVGPRVRAV